MSQIEKVDSEVNLEKENRNLKKIILQERLIRFDSQIQLLYELRQKTQVELNNLE